MQPTSQTYAELQTAYDHFNKVLFGDGLPPCLLTLQREKRTYGYFCRNRFVKTGNPQEAIDEIALNPAYFGRNIPGSLPYQQTMQTIVHEMCHLWQFHFGTPGRTRYHNREWGDKMKEVGLMPSNTGAPGGKQTGDQMTDYAIENGRFLTAYKLLLQTDFSLSWRDRFAEFVEANPTEGPVVGLPVAVGGFTAPRPQTRVKYTCPACETNVWGKPDINLMCGDCGVAFEAVN